jgi:hypothetical protein
MTIEELVRETLVEKNRRLRQAKCCHEEVYSSTVAGPTGTSTNSFCLDCGKSWAKFQDDDGEWAARYRKAIDDLNRLNDKGLPTAQDVRGILAIPE